MIQHSNLCFYIISLIFAKFGHMEILSQLINIVDQNPDS
ncbi:MAG: AraC family transcriptional regulator, partial [Chryseobacterium sp.]|nr:AraC family transcriptional regulator [Chryseobacterium sp.]